MNFADLGLSEVLLKNIAESGYKTATPIQAGAIPVLLEGHDLLGIAQTGTGKTAAFSLPIIQHLIKNPRKLGFSGPRGLILVPTRELASQITESLNTYSKDLGIKSLAVYGGVNQSTQMKEAKGVDVLVATPGRLLDLLQQKLLRLDRIELFVLDEADRMLDMGFIEDIEKIIDELPEKKQSMFFSATIPDDVDYLARRILTNPKRVEVAPSGSSVSAIDQKVITCKRQDKLQLLKKIIKSEKVDLMIIFTKQKNSADRVKEYLRFHKIVSVIIHGDKEQSERERALAVFKKGDIKYLIATDIVARGIDIPDVSHVVNFELPMEAESYVHRIGRTGRAGKKGIAITFCDDSERGILERVQKLMKVTIPTESYQGTPEAAGVWSAGTMMKRTTAPTPGKSQEKTAYLDHSKRQKVLKEGEKARPHPGFKKKKKSKR